MSETSLQPKSSTGMNSVENVSTPKEGTAGPMVIGISIASVVVVLCLVFLAYYLIRRKRQAQMYRYSIKSDAEMSLAQVSKMDYLPPEPSAPPPPYKDVEGEKADLEPTGQPPVPPKDSGRPFIRTRGLSDDIRKEPTVDEMVSFPPRTFSFDRNVF